jgi:glycine/D-amino acid oxidase-like deaminating enzyme
MAREIVVIGGGIIGASIAWHLTEAGAKVSLICETQGGVATPNSFAWINASRSNPPDYFKLRMRSIAEWPRLAEKVPGLPLSFKGGICWDMSHEELLAYAKQHTEWGYDIGQIDAAEIARMEPALKHLPDLAVLARTEGVAEPLAAANALLEDAARKGLKIIEARVTGLHRNEQGRVTAVRTTAGEFPADEIVLAAGAETVELAETAGIDVPLETPPGLLVHSKPVVAILNGLIIAPELHVRQTDEGRIVAGTDFGGMDPGTDPEAAAAELFGKVKAFLKGGEDLELDFYTIGYRPTPRDGFPIIGRANGTDGLYLAVTHSGITLAPALGLFASREILEGTSESLLAPYRLSRFA